MNHLEHKCEVVMIPNVQICSRDVYFGKMSTFITQTSITKLQILKSVQNVSKINFKILFVDNLKNTEIFLHQRSFAF